MRHIMLVFALAALMMVSAVAPALAEPTFAAPPITPGEETTPPSGSSPPALQASGPTEVEDGGESETCRTLEETPVADEDSKDALTFGTNRFGLLRCSIDLPTPEEPVEG